MLCCHWAEWLDCSTCNHRVVGSNLAKLTADFTMIAVEQVMLYMSWLEDTFQAFHHSFFLIFRRAKQIRTPKDEYYA